MVKYRNLEANVSIFFFENLHLLQNGRRMGFFNEMRAVSIPQFRD